MIAKIVLETVLLVLLAPGLARFARQHSRSPKIKNVIASMDRLLWMVNAEQLSPAEKVLTISTTRALNAPISAQPV